MRKLIFALVTLMLCSCATLRYGWDYYNVSVLNDLGEVVQTYENVTIEHVQKGQDELSMVSFRDSRGTLYTVSGSAIIIEESQVSRPSGRYIYYDESILWLPYPGTYYYRGRPLPNYPPANYPPPPPRRSEVRPGPGGQPAPPPRGGQLTTPRGRRR